MVKKILFCLAVAMVLSVVRVDAGSRNLATVDPNNRVYSSLAFQGADYKLVTTTTSFTAVDTGFGIIQAIYAICNSTYTSGAVYVVATDTTVAILTASGDTGLDVPVSAANVNQSGPSKTRLVDPTGLIPIRYSSGLKVKPVSTNSGSDGSEIDVLILYWSLD